MRAVPARAIPDGVWDRFVAAHPGGWLFHTKAGLRYGASRPIASDGSFGVLTPEGQVAGICPLIEETHEDGVSWLFGGEPGPAPLAATSEAADCLADHFAELRAERKPIVVAFRYQPVPPGAPIPEGRQTTGAGLSWMTEVVDLSRSLDAILRGFRKSHRSGRTDVRKLAEQYLVVSGSEHLPDFMDVTRTFWEGKTWPPKRWAVLEQWLENGTARLFGVPGQAWVLVFSDKGWAYYAAGPSRDRHLGLPALCQWVAIQALKADGVRYYELGWHARPGEDEKHQRIATWKQGFGGEQWTVYAAI